MSTVVEVQPSSRRGNKSSMRLLRVSNNLSIEDAIEEIIESFHIDTGHCYDIQFRNGYESALENFKNIAPALFLPPTTLVGNLPWQEGDVCPLHYDFGDDHRFTILVKALNGSPCDSVEVLDSVSANTAYTKLQKKVKKEISTDPEGIYITGGFGDSSSGKDPMLADFLKWNPEKTKQWEYLPPLPESYEYNYLGDPVTGNDDHVAVIHDNKMYTFGGRVPSRIDQYDFATNTWTKEALKQPKHWCQERNLHAAVIGDIMYVYGSYDYQTKQTLLQAYNFQTGNWTNLPFAPTSRYECASVAVGSKLFILGGNSKEFGMDYFGGKDQQKNVIYSSVEVFDVETNTWHTNCIAPMISARKGCAAAYCDGYIYVTGGKSGKLLASAERYSLLENKWEQLPDMILGPRSHHVSAAFKGKVYVLGGVGPNNKRAHDRCAVYDPLTKEWEKSIALSERMNPTVVVIENNSNNNLNNNNNNNSNNNNNNNNNNDNSTTNVNKTFDPKKYTLPNPSTFASTDQEQKPKKSDEIYLGSSEEEDEDESEEEEEQKRKRGKNEDKGEKGRKKRK